MELPALDAPLILGVLLVVLGLGVYGLRDLLKFSVGRAWAVGGVVFRESVRRRVLWITPLAMLAVLLLVRLQNPADEADAIRQATRFCLFASGLVAVLVTLVLACTNLPREMESRVIFTIVTKPLTRLELLVGKVLGLARLAALLLLIMGVFSYGLLLVLNATLVGDVRERLAGPLALEAERPYLEHLADGGLLRAEHVDAGDDLQVYAVAPDVAASRGEVPRYTYPLAYYAAFPFEPTAELIDEIAAAGDVRLAFDLRLPWRANRVTPLLQQTAPAVRVQMLDGLLYNLVGPGEIEDNIAQLPPEPTVPWDESPTIRLSDAQTARTLAEARRGRFFAAIYLVSEDYLLGILPDVVRARIETPDGQTLATLEIADRGDPRGHILARTYLGNFGLGLTGPEGEAAPPVGVLAFRDTDLGGLGETVGFEVVGRADPTGESVDMGDATRVRVEVYNLASGQVEFGREAVVETGRVAYVEAPASSVAGGDFDLRITTLTRGQVVSVRGENLRLIVGTEPFWLNLLKVLAGQWLLAVLVSVAGLAFSTFVGWPIAATMVVILLSGRWLVGQLGGALGGGYGRSVADSVFGGAGDDGGSVAGREAVRVGADALAETLTTLTRFLPDVGAFGLGDAASLGLAADPAALGAAALTCLAYGLPLLALAYVVLRNKEVAP